MNMLLDTYPVAVVTAHRRSPGRGTETPAEAPAPCRTRVHVLLAQDHALFRSGVRSTLRGDSEIEIVAETGTAAEVVTLARRTHPDTVLLGLELDGQTTLAYLERVRAGVADAPVIVVADAALLAQAEELFDRGAASVILKTIELDELAPAIKAVVRGARNQVFGARGLDESTLGNVLTPREIETLKALVAGLTNRGIAEELSVTEHTVKFHLTSVYRKLGLRSRAEAAHWSVENGVVSRAFAERSCA